MVATAGCRPFHKIFNALIYFLSSLDRVSLWGKLWVYSSIFLSGHPSSTSLTSLFTVPIGANLWPAGNGLRSAGFDPRFLVIPNPAGLQEGGARSLVPDRQGKGDQSPLSSMMEVGVPPPLRENARRGEVLT